MPAPPDESTQYRLYSTTPMYSDGRRAGGRRGATTELWGPESSPTARRGMILQLNWNSVGVRSEYLSSSKMGYAPLKPH